MKHKEPFLHTFSIIARDEVSGDVGVGIVSHWFTLDNAIWGEPGVGMVVTQAFCDPSYGPNALELLRQGEKPEDIIETLTLKDTRSDVRQIGIMNATGETAAFTGEHCTEYAHHKTSQNVSVQANMMISEDVVPAVFEAYASSDGSLADRILHALRAGQEAGGDIRGQQSAMLYIIRGQACEPWEKVLVDLRATDQKEPLTELQRLVTIQKSYDMMDLAEEAMLKGDKQATLKYYCEAQKLNPSNIEITYWKAISLINLGDMEAATPLLGEVFEKGGQNWKELIGRLKQSRDLQLTQEQFETIMNL